MGKPELSVELQLVSKGGIVRQDGLSVKKAHHRVAFRAVLAILGRGEHARGAVCSIPKVNARVHDDVHLRACPVAVVGDVHFGHESYVAIIVWEHRTMRENRSAFSHNHE